VKRLAILVTGSLMLAGIVPFHTVTGTQAQGMAGAMPETVTVLVGSGQAGVSSGSWLGFSPKYVDITVGDTVVFKLNDSLEPHTVTFGPMSQLKALVNSFVVPVMQKNGPPQVAVNSQAAMPTPGHTYDGTGLANSGFMAKAGQTWKLTFTKAGTYHYICLVHGPSMTGVVIVHPALAPMGKTWMVQAGDGQIAGSDQANTTTEDQFYPRHITIHVGDTVEWIGGFHTITFGPDAMLTQLEKNLVVTVPQASGAPKLMLNTKITTPAGGPTYDGMGFVNSGILAFSQPPNSKVPPSFKLTFTATGTFAYDCLIHPHMDGTVTVVK
jgi:plastocyanin